MNQQLIKKILLILSLILLPVIGWVLNDAYTNMQRNTAKDIGGEFISSILAGDYETAFNNSSSELQEQIPLDEFSSAFEEYKLDEPNAFDGNLLTADDRTLYVQYVDGFTNIGKNNTAAEFTLNMEKDGFSWKVSNITIQ